MDPLSAAACAALVGFAAGLTVDAATQVIGLMQGNEMSFSDALGQVDWNRAVIAGGVGAAGAVLSAVAVPVLGAAAGAAAVEIVGGVRALVPVAQLAGDVAVTSGLMGILNIAQTTALNQVVRWSRDEVVSPNEIADDLRDNWEDEFRMGAMMGAISRIGTHLIYENTNGVPSNFTMYDGAEPAASSIKPTVAQQNALVIRAVSLPATQFLTDPGVVGLISSMWSGPRVTAR